MPVIPSPRLIESDATFGMPDPVPVPPVPVPPCWAPAGWPEPSRIDSMPVALSVTQNQFWYATMPHALTSDESTLATLPDWSEVRFVTETTWAAPVPLPPPLPLPAASSGLPPELSPAIQPAASNSAPIAPLLALKWNAMIQPPAEKPRRTFLQAVSHFPPRVSGGPLAGRGGSRPVGARRRRSPRYRRWAQIVSLTVMSDSSFPIVPFRPQNSPEIPDLTYVAIRPVIHMKISRSVVVGVQSSARPLSDFPRGVNRLTPRGRGADWSDRLRRVDSTIGRGRSSSHAWVISEELRGNPPVGASEGSV